MEVIERRTGRNSSLSETPAARRLATVSGIGIIDVSFPANMSLPRHDHEHGYLCLVAGGSFAESWGNRERHASVGSFFYYPAQLPHRGSFGNRGARVLHFEIPGGDLGMVCPGGTDTKVAREDLRNTSAAGLAWQLFRELEVDSDPNELAVESLVGELIAEIFGEQFRRDRAVPAWIDTVEQILRSVPTTRSLSAISAQVRLHPSHLAREFHRHTGSTLGQRARRLQVARAAGKVELLEQK